MIEFLPHKKIDKQNWDRCIAESGYGRIFAYSWFLDLICPGWNGLVEDDYEAVFPLTWGRKFGISYLYQPFFTQQLGIFSRSVPDSEKVNEFLMAIPERYKFIDICLNSCNDVPPGRFQIFSNKTHELNLARNYEGISHRYSENTRRNIKKAVDQNIVVSREDRLDDLIAMFRSNLGRLYPRIRAHHYAKLYSIMTGGMTRETGKTYVSRTVNGLICAAAYFICSNHRHIFLFSGNIPESRENGAMFLLVDQFIRDHSGEDSLLDFMGSNLESLARFYTGFGSQEIRYPRIKRNQLPWPVRLVKGGGQRGEG